MNLLLFGIVCFGMVAVCLCFTFLMPIVANLLLFLFSTFVSERLFSKLNRQPSGADFIDPNQLDYSGSSGVK